MMTPLVMVKGGGVVGVVPLGRAEKPSKLVRVVTGTVQ